MAEADQRLQNGSFDYEATRAMGAAYDKACLALDGASEPELIREFIATRIVRIAKTGERDPDRLCVRPCAR